MNGKAILKWALNCATWLLLAVLLILAFLIDERIVSQRNLVVILLQAVPIGVLGLGVFWVLLIGEIDLSAGHAVSFGAVVMGTLISGGMGLLPTLGIGLAACLSVGLVNGILVGGLKLPSFIATLATMLLLQGATLIVARSGIIMVLDPTLRTFGGFNSPLGAPPTLIFAAVLAAACWIVSRQTAFGLRTYALGSSAERAVLMGVSVSFQRIAVFLISSVFVFCTALVIIARVPVVNPSVGGISLLLDAIAAAVIGGTSLFGGKGRVSGVIGGAIIISLLTAALRIVGVEPSSLDLYKGLMIVLILLSDRGFTFLRATTDNAARSV